ncbi:permease [Tsukamurella soli]|uniref:Permease n=1 Tax=Tsukamurella soli TaxID=644556 RepID=A0ABP8J9Z2_9ACTN
MRPRRHTTDDPSLPSAHESDRTYEAGRARRPETRRGPNKWLVRALAVVGVIALAVVAYFILAAFIPRWWGQRMGHLIEGSFSRGIAWGLFFGLVCTLVPLLLLMVAAYRLVGRGHGRLSKTVGGLAAVLAVVVAVPNLMTLTIVWGAGNGAHAGQRIMDIEAPAFRGASLAGAIVAVIVTVGVWWLVFRYRKRGRDLRKVRTRAEQAPSAPPEESA